MKYMWLYRRSIFVNIDDTNRALVLLLYTSPLSYSPLHFARKIKVVEIETKETIVQYYIAHLLLKEGQGIGSSRRYYTHTPAFYIPTHQSLPYIIMPYMHIVHIHRNLLVTIIKESMTPYFNPKPNNND